MQKVRMKTSLAGADYAHAFGAELSLDDVTANQWVRAGIAEYVVDAPKVETADAKHDGAERAVQRVARKPKAGE
jgi:hypothetical protein